jgi:hypothetical protein
MKPSEIKKTFQKMFTERLNQHGFYSDPKFESFLVKKLPNGMTIGVYPRFGQSRGAWKVIFEFGAYLPVLEQQLDAFAGSAMRQPVNHGWTLFWQNLNFPKDYNSYHRAQFLWLVPPLISDQLASTS